ncbi:MAG: AMP-binding protein [Solirubrobacteraceae bacterium]
MRAIDYFDKGVARDPQRLLAVSGGDALTFAEGQELSWRIARGLYGAGFLRGDGVAVFAPNEPIALAAMLGAWRAGGAWVPLNPRNAPDASIRYMGDVGARWLFYHSSFREEAAAIADAVPSVKRAICLDDASSSRSLERFVDEGTAFVDWGDPFGNPDVVMAYFPTGGTTGASKASKFTNRAWSAMIDIALSHWPGADDPVNLMVAPITHAAGGTAAILATIGATTVMHAGFEPGAALAEIERRRVTHVFLPPTAYYALLDHPSVAEHDLSSLRMVLISAAPVAPDRLARGVELFGPSVCQCYGQAESPFVLSWLPPEVVAAAAAGDHGARLASAGRATLPTVLGIMDEEGNLLEPGARGEIVARGRLVADGYLDRPEETAEVRTHGWHHTGDVGYLDEDGFLYIVDRKKDMIISGGFNVYSSEVEAAVLSLDEIRECAVIGIPDDRWGEMVTAVVVRTAESEIGADRIIATCKATLGSVKTPKRIEFVDALPKTPTGKIDKKVVRSAYWAGRDRLVG